MVPCVICRKLSQKLAFKPLEKGVKLKKTAMEACYSKEQQEEEISPVAYVLPLQNHWTAEEEPSCQGRCGC